MSRSFTKLFSSITESTVWCEPLATRVVWVTLLAMADRHGRVWASVPGLAGRARVTVHQAEVALERFLAPDHHSRTKDYEGRRIEPIDGGWRLLNYAKYREMRDEEERREYQADWVKAKRRQKVSTVDQSRPRSTQAEAEAEAEAVKSKALRDADASLAGRPEAGNAQTAVPPCPHERIVELYHEALPMLSRVVDWTPKRRAYLQAAWRQQAKPNGTISGYTTQEKGLVWWREFFEYVARSKFLTGQAGAKGRDTPFRANLEWLIRPSNFVKVLEGNYESDRDLR